MPIPGRIAHSPLMKPLVVLALPGMYLFYKYNQYKRQQQEQNRRKVTERELAHLNHKIDKLLTKLDEHEPEVATCQEDECVICVNAKATMQTFPCGHRVVCRKCFVKTIQVAVSQRLLPLRCVICRAKILRLKQTMPCSASDFSLGISSSASAPAFPVATSASLYSMSSDHSNISGVSSISSASSASTSSMKPAKSSASKIRLSSYHQSTGTLKKSQSQIVKGAKMQGYIRLARTPSPSPSQPLVAPSPRRAYDVLSSVSAVSGVSLRETRASRPTLRDNKVAPDQQPPPKLTPIKEFQREFRASKERIAKEAMPLEGHAHAQTPMPRTKVSQKVSCVEAGHPLASYRSRSAPSKSSRKEEKRKDEEEVHKDKDKEEKTDKFKRESAEHKADNKHGDKK